ncbi:MAG TPA: RNA 2',3'-cyclic phosphodiesterase [Gallionella sp.]|nr:RNA 2',3'-cyclic phosphodiesterase [Gallionella sp.]
MSDKPDSTVRVFFALWPNASERAALAGWQPPLRELCGGRAMPAANLHNTLVFVGNVAEHRLEALQLAAQEVEGERFDLRFDQARYWGHNHIVFAAPRRVPPQLAQLVRDLEQRLEHHRFRFDRRDYKPHVTLLRHSKWSDAPLPEMPAVPWPVHDFVLVQSPQQEGDSHYRVLARFPLMPRP